MCVFCVFIFGGLLAQPRIANAHPMSVQDNMDALPEGIVDIWPPVSRSDANLVVNNVVDVQMANDADNNPLSVENVNGAGNVPVAGNVNATNDDMDGNVSGADNNMRVGAVPLFGVPIRRQFVPSSLPSSAVSSRHLVNGESYASRAASARTGHFSSNTATREATRRENFVDDMPKRPRSALFTPSRNTSARSVFQALNNAAISAAEINCLQRKMNGECVITFKSEDAKEKFVSMNSIRINSEHYAIQDIDRPLTYLTIYDAPGRFDFMPDVYNGLRHYRVRVLKPVPSFLRFGRVQVLLRHEGQVPTCRRCNLQGHFYS